MSELLRTYSEVIETLERLPTPRHGRVRVYRGQPAAYPTMLSTQFRHPDAVRSLWYAYALALGRFLNPPPDVDAPPKYDSERLARIILNESLLQHYGAPSPYIDVTADVSVALWFALFQRVGSPATFAVADGVWATTIFGFKPVTAAGHFFVLDVEDWRGRTREHGRLFDIQAMSETTDRGYVNQRAICQSGALVYADSDLLTHVVADLAVSPNLLTDDDWEPPSQHELFPDPADDPVLHALASVPLLPDLDAPGGEGTLAYKHPLDLDLYRPTTAGAFDDRLRVLPAPLVHAEMDPAFDFARVPGDAGPRWPTSHPISHTVPVVFEAPVLSIAEGTRWRDKDLLGDLARETSLEGGNEVLDLTSVLFEYTPLEQQFWGSEEDTGDELVLLRALWLVQDPAVGVLALIQGPDEAGNAGIYTDGPYLVHLGHDGELDFADLSGEPVSEGKRHALRSPVRTALSLLRDLNPLPKEPNAYFELLSGNRVTAMSPGRTAQQARLLAPQRLHHGSRCFRARNVDNAKPYTAEPPWP